MPFTFQIEKIAAVLPEMEQTVPIQHAETGDSDFPCEPAWEVYARLEQVGAALLTLREEGRLIGYAACFFHPHLNSKHTKIGTIPSFWVEIRPNRALLLRSLLQHGAEVLWRKGASKVTIETEPVHSCGRLLEAMDYRVEKISYSMKRIAAKKEANYA